MQDGSLDTDAHMDDEGAKYKAHAGLDFEDALKRLEEIVHRLERGEAKLDELIALYKEGEHLRTLCQKRLDDAKMQIDKVTQSADGSIASVEDFDKDG